MIRALGFLTVVGRPRRPVGSTVDWFPLAGTAIGAAVGGVWLVARHAWAPAPAAAIAVVFDLVITGMLHLDGVADTADGVLAHLDRGRRLEVMAEPTIGAFGIGAAGAVLLIRWACLDALVPNVALLAALYCVSRTVMAVTVRTVRYAREDVGLASTFLGGRRWWWLASEGAVLGIGLGYWAEGFHGLVAVVGAGVAGAVVVRFCRRRLGGFTGDVLGGAGMVAETVGLLVAAAH